MLNRIRRNTCMMLCLNSKLERCGKIWYLKWFKNDEKSREYEKELPNYICSDFDLRNCGKHGNTTKQKSNLEYSKKRNGKKTSFVKSNNCVKHKQTKSFKPLKIRKKKNGSKWNPKNRG